MTARRARDAASPRGDMQSWTAVGGCDGKLAPHAGQAGSLAGFVKIDQRKSNKRQVRRPEIGRVVSARVPLKVVCA